MIVPLQQRTCKQWTVFPDPPLLKTVEDAKKYLQPRPQHKPPLLPGTLRLLWDPGKGVSPERTSPELRARARRAPVCWASTSSSISHHVHAPQLGSMPAQRRCFTPTTLLIFATPGTRQEGHHVTSEDVRLSGVNCCKPQPGSERRARYGRGFPASASPSALSTPPQPVPPAIAQGQ